MFAKGEILKLNKQKLIYTENHLQQIAKNIRLVILESLRPRESHHIGCSFSILDIVTYLYFRELNINPKKPFDKNRDIFILSKGHAALAVYATLYKRGFFSKKILQTYDQDGGLLPEHISKVVSGIEFATGSLGHGLPVGIGFAIAALHDEVRNRVVVLMSDGELNEGSNWEAIMYAGHHKLKNLIVIIDNNGYQGYSSTQNVINLSPLSQKLQDFRWNTYEIDGHNFTDLVNVFKLINTKKNDLPHFIIAKTVKGKGVPFFEGTFESHYKSIDEKTKKRLISELKKTL